MSSCKLDFYMEQSLVENCNLPVSDYLRVYFEIILVLQKIRTGRKNTLEKLCVKDSHNVLFSLNSFLSK